MKYCVITFHSTHHALQAEKAAKETGISFKLIAPPRQFSANCGIAICTEWKDRETMKTLLQEKHIPHDTFHDWTIQ